MTAPCDVLFRDVIGRFATGVAVVGAHRHGRDFGTTASAVTSLSLSPPMLLVCLNRSSATQATIRHTGVFAVSVLNACQAEIARGFADKGADKFAQVGVERGPGGLPLVPGAIAQLECEVDQTATGGTHDVFLSHVRDAVGTEGAPLTYYRGQFGSLAGADAGRSR